MPRWKIKYLTLFADFNVLFSLAAFWIVISTLTVMLALYRVILHGVCVANVCIPI